MDHDPLGSLYSTSQDWGVLLGPEPVSQGDAQGNGSIYLPAVAGYNPGWLLLGLVAALTAFGVWTSSISASVKL